MKIGRNEKCPCGSGNKYKKCCASKQQSLERTTEPEQQKKITLGGAIKTLQQIATTKQEFVEQLGVFILFSDTKGDAWVLEVTDSDCIQVADGGNALEVPLEETAETIIMDWSHRFSIKKKQLHISAYRKKEERILKLAPSQKIAALARRILKKLTPEVLEQVHVTE